MSVVERFGEVTHVAGRRLLEIAEAVSQLGIGRVTRETERRRRSLCELHDGEARQRRTNVEPVAERRQESSDGRPLGRQRAVDDDGDVERRVERVVHAACQVHSSSSSSLSSLSAAAATTQ